jgi:hypothetical protein
MTKAEFIERYRAQQKHVNGWLILWFVIFVGGLIAGGVFSRHLESQSPLSRLIFGVGFFLLIVGSLALLLWLLRRDINNFGLGCPSCGKPLVGVSAQIAIAAGHCGHCGTKLFSDTPSTQTPNEPSA